MLPEGVPAFEAYYDSKKLWPPESLARRAAHLRADGEARPMTNNRAVRFAQARKPARRLGARG